MAKPRLNPFDRGTPEWTIYDRFRKATATAATLEKQAAVAMTTARAERASAERYAEALRSLGHADKVPGQKALPNYAGLGEYEQAERAGLGTSLPPES
jgi:hypothetical protein